MSASLGAASPDSKHHTAHAQPAVRPATSVPAQVTVALHIHASGVLVVVHVEDEALGRTAEARKPSHGVARATSQQTFHNADAVVHRERRVAIRTGVVAPAVHQTELVLVLAILGVPGEDDAGQTDPVVRTTAGDPVDLAVGQHVHARAAAVVVEVEDQTLARAARTRQLGQVAPPARPDQTAHHTEVAHHAVRAAAVAAAVVAPAVPQRQTALADPSGDKGNAAQGHPAVAFASGHPVHLAVAKHVQANLRLVVVDGEDQPLRRPAASAKGGDQVPAAALDETFKDAQAAALEHAGTHVAAAVVPPAVHQPDAVLGGSRRAAGVASFDSKHHTAHAQPAVRPATSVPAQVTVALHIHASGVLVVVHVEDEALGRTAEARKPSHGVARATSQQTFHNADAVVHRERRVAIRTGVVAPAVHQTELVLVLAILGVPGEDDAGQTDPVVRTTAGDPVDLAVGQHVHARAAAVVVEVEDQTLARAARTRQLGQVAPPARPDQTAHHTEVAHHAVRAAAVAAAVVAPAVPQRQTALADPSGDKGNAAQGHPAVAFASGHPVHLAVAKHVQANLRLVVVDGEDQPLRRPAASAKGGDQVPAAALDETFKDAQAAALEHAGTHVAAAVVPPAVHQPDAVLGGSRRAAGVASFDSKHHTAHAQPA
eukprot:CAMPEP_0175180494 /NCGR_PEP_ID=MMETSP0087-20121206/36107_1 /TAXON_ID=136419 /ORGANISM="Unknown Unknown, Strain D1" /LENGTH=656 /DNA_ID=CAMNT_0016472857 /DNA_START=906 /DNA_END=2873 /DNA_ORIENTATION=-